MGKILEGENGLKYLLHPTDPRLSDIRWNLNSKSNIKKIFHRELVIRTIPTTLLEIFCDLIKVIFKSMISPDESGIQDPNAWIGLITSLSYVWGLKGSVWRAFKNSYSRYTFHNVPNQALRVLFQSWVFSNDSDSDRSTTSHCDVV